MKKFLVFAIILGVAILVAAGVPYYTSRNEVLDERAGNDITDGIASQHILSVSGQPHAVYALYHDGRMVAVVHDKEKLDHHLKQVYQDQYSADFPSSSLSLADGYKLEKELSYYTWSNADDEIISWLDRNNAYALNAVEIAFSNDQGIYARIYVSDVSLYENALKKYLACFVDGKYLDQLLNGKNVSMPSNYGSADVGLNMVETASTVSAKASPAQIYTSEDQVLEYLKYGGNTNKTYYTVQAGDTLAGVGEKNGGLSPEQLVAVNPDVLHSTEDALQPGEKLCVTYFESPLTIQVYRARMVQESIPCRTDYVQNFTTNDDQPVVQQGSDGSRNTLYRETWVNGVLEKSEEVSTADSVNAVNQIRQIDEDQERGIGSGLWQLPVDHAEVSCDWGCLLNYEAVSYRNAYDSWSNVYAADNGSVEDSGYDEENGNWIKINHHNGMYSCYAHLQEPSALEKGTIVQKGDVIGQIGTTGNSTYPHLKFWLEDDLGHHINPRLSGFPSCPN